MGGSTCNISQKLVSALSRRYYLISYIMCMTWIYNLRVSSSELYSLSLWVANFFLQMEVNFWVTIYFLRVEIRYLQIYETNFTSWVFFFCELQENFTSWILFFAEWDKKLYLPSNMIFHGFHSVFRILIFRFVTFPATKQFLWDSRWIFDKSI